MVSLINFGESPFLFLFYLVGGVFVLTLFINIFAENKLGVKEGVDWSYWRTGRSLESSNVDLFTRFVRELSANDLSVGIYDSRKPQQ